ncbi:nudix hydrolase 2-like isoform X3 [Macadamia integrifolia]|uniref:nudix hydrolase 2-like isoform X3 n=1 Tax=Macadamia integrifolia TaxID=60698 RepID=UPI001C4F577A|nr:nudix hydrolase 2-like isoform X3 [Macadamia integrifolia]
MLRFLSRPSSSSSFHLIKSRNANVTANQILCGSSFAINSSLDAIKGVKVRMMSPLINYVRARGISIPVRTPPLLMENVKTVQNNDAPPVQLLYGSNDGHGGVIVDLKDPMDSHLFVASLRASLSQWKRQGKKGIWIKIPIELANLVEAAVKEGFRFHHAEPKYLMLAHWLPETPNTLPANVTHQVGVGAFVMNDKKEVLVVQERIGKLQGIGLWKFPTGVINEGEDICVGAVREVKEETGIDTEFVEVLAFSESTKTFFEKSDLFFFCMLRPRSFEIQMQELEIEAAQVLLHGSSRDEMVTSNRHVPT